MSGQPAPRATLRLTLTCSNRCVFCAQEGLPPQAEVATASGLDARLVALRERADELTLVGGEPALAPDLAGVVAAARRAGFARVGLQTNGSGLAGTAAGLAAAGLTDVHLSLHGATAPVHDYHTGRPGSFAEAALALTATRAAGLEVVVATVLTRSSYRSLAALPPFLTSQGVAAWLVEVPHAAGRAAAAFDRVMPRLGLALPFALHALEAAGRLGLPAWIRGAPLCALGPLGTRALPGEERAFAEACTSCPARARCPGVDPIYLARFGGDELRVREVASPAAGGEALRRMFVGPGDRADAPAPAAIAPPPAAVRRSLPVLGKVRPAVAEVSAAAPKRSGEALREIFPSLFGAADGGKDGSKA